MNTAETEFIKLAKHLLTKFNYKDTIVLSEYEVYPEHIQFGIKLGYIELKHSVNTAPLTNTGNIYYDTVELTASGIIFAQGLVNDEKELATDNINPSYYADKTVSPIQLMEAYGIDIPFAIGSIIKYVARYKEKNGLEDLKKARWYIHYVISKLSDGNDLEVVVDSIKNLDSEIYESISIRRELLGAITQLGILDGYR